MRRPTVYITTMVRVCYDGLRRESINLAVQVVSILGILILGVASIRLFTGNTALLWTDEMVMNSPVLGVGAVVTLGLINVFIILGVLAVCVPLCQAYARQTDDSEYPVQYDMVEIILSGIMFLGLGALFFTLAWITGLSHGFTF